MTMTPEERAQDLRDSVRDYRSSVTTSEERLGIWEYWNSLGLPNQFAAALLAADLES